MPVTGLPTILEHIINKILDESQLASYKFAGNQQRTTLVLRFDSMADTSVPTFYRSTPPASVSFRRKSPSQTKRDQQRQQQHKSVTSPVKSTSSQNIHKDDRLEAAEIFESTTISRIDDSALHSLGSSRLDLDLDAAKPAIRIDLHPRNNNRNGKDIDLNLGLDKTERHNNRNDHRLNQEKENPAPWKHNTESDGESSNPDSSHSTELDTHGEHRENPNRRFDAAEPTTPSRSLSKDSSQHDSNLDLDVGFDDTGIQNNMKDHHDLGTANQGCQEEQSTATAARNDSTCKTSSDLDHTERETMSRNDQDRENPKRSLSRSWIQHIHSRNNHAKSNHGDRVQLQFVRIKSETAKYITKPERNNDFTKLLLDTFENKRSLIAETEDLILEYDIRKDEIVNLIIKSEQDSPYSRMRKRHTRDWRDMTGLILDEDGPDTVYTFHTRAAQLKKHIIEYFRRQ